MFIFLDKLTKRVRKVFFGTTLSCFPALLTTAVSGRYTISYYDEHNTYNIDVSCENNYLSKHEVNIILLSYYNNNVISHGLASSRVGVIIDAPATAQGIWLPLHDTPQARITPIICKLQKTSEFRIRQSTVFRSPSSPLHEREPPQPYNHDKYLSYIISCSDLAFCNVI